MAPIEPVSQSTAAQYTPATRNENQNAADTGAQTGAGGGNPQYLSPVIQVDPMTGVAVTQIRDRQTGEEVAQYPSKRVVAEYARHSGTEVQSREATQGPVLQAQAVAAVAQVQATNAAAQQQKASSDQDA